MLPEERCRESLKKKSSATEGPSARSSRTDLGPRLVTGVDSSQLECATTTASRQEDSLVSRSLHVSIPTRPLEPIRLGGKLAGACEHDREKPRERRRGADGHNRRRGDKDGAQGLPQCEKGAQIVRRALQQARKSATDSKNRTQRAHLEPLRPLIDPGLHLRVLRAADSRRKRPEFPIMCPSCELNVRIVGPGRQE